ncbi:MAG: dienelactone hydrolase family protein [Alphaproteobacteria bacterium]|nr:dienelactone hydrolase family protein [Alphaproteobacteria bacterium]
MVGDVRIRTGDGADMGALFSPASAGPAPGIVVLQEIFGRTDFLRTRLELFNAHGYAAMAPDLYHRISPGAAFDYSGDDWTGAFAVRNRLDDDLAVDDVGASIAALRARPECTGKIVVVGYCLGGLLAFLSAARTEADANVCFHGVRLEQRLEVAKAINGPLQIHFAGRDKWAPPEIVARIKAALPEGGGIEYVEYPDADHGFTREGQPVFDPIATAQAHAALFDFIERTVA